MQTTFLIHRGALKPNAMAVPQVTSDCMVAV